MKLWYNVKLVVSCVPSPTPILTGVTFAMCIPDTKHKNLDCSAQTGSEDNHMHEQKRTLLIGLIQMRLCCSY